MHNKSAPENAGHIQALDLAPLAESDSDVSDSDVEPTIDAESEQHLEPETGVRSESVVAAALLKLDLEAAQRLSRRVGPKKNITTHLQENAATERQNRETLNEIAASLGISRSTVNRFLDEPPVHHGGKHIEHRSFAGKRHDHGTGRRRHAG